MKTNYHPRNNVPTTHRRFALVLGLFLGGVLIFTLLRGPLTTLVSPIWKSSNFFSRAFSSVLAVVRSKESLESENEALQGQLVSYNALLVSSRALADSRDELLSNFNRASTTPGIAAAILVHPPETPYDVLIIDAGTSAGVVVGDRVSIPEGVAIGTISSVSPTNAQVVLYSSGETKTNAVLERGGLPIVLVGRGSGNFEFDLPKGTSVSVGDKILSPALRSQMIAVVGDVEDDPTDSLEHILASSVANVFALRFVLVTP